VTPDDKKAADVSIEVDELTFVLAKRDADFVKRLGGIEIEENRFWGGISVRPLRAMRFGC
jgi:hypothetical protein